MDLTRSGMLSWLYWCHWPPVVVGQNSTVSVWQARATSTGATVWQDCATKGSRRGRRTSKRRTRASPGSSACQSQRGARGTGRSQTSVGAPRLRLLEGPRKVRGGECWRAGSHGGGGVGRCPSAARRPQRSEARGGSLAKLSCNEALLLGCKARPARWRAAPRAILPGVRRARRQEVRQA